MGKVIRNIDKDQQEFVGTINKIAYRFQTWEVWRDFIVMFATALSNAVDKVHCEKREQSYMLIVKKYTKQELALFPELCAMTVKALEVDRDRDFLGEMYMALNLGNHWTGQFFTPYSICKAMTMMTGGDFVSQIQNKGCIEVNDPACGAGATLIAFANVAQLQLTEAGYNFQNHILFTAQDIDMITGLMCYIQLSLLGCAGYVKIDNTLAHPMSADEAMKELSKPESCYWYTPMYFSDIWHYRRVCKAIDTVISKAAEQVTVKLENTAEMAVSKNDDTAEAVTGKLKQEKADTLMTRFVVERNGQLALF